ncbi:MAG: glycosyltransferase [Candidatus Methanoperedens sp.]|nr:glycosyltransferase [Candidatus Methanoperedens sp.]CAG0969438.1 Mannosylfructose-phosphate synthase [Methanosarcinales archaeon]
MNMKICIVGPSKRFLSGISYYTIRLANTLSSSCDVYVLNYRKLLPEFLFPGRGHIGKNISDIELSPAVKVFDGMDYNDPATWYSAYMYLRASRPDVIILQWWTSSVSHMHLLVKIIGYLYNSKLIMEFHEVVDPLEEGILPIRLYSKFMGKLLRKNASCFITHSESDKKLIAIRYGIHPGKIHVIPHGLYDQYDILEKNIAREKFSIKEEYVILSFGLIRRYKGIKYLIKAFEQLPEDIIKRSRLLIVGEIWEDREDLLDQINSSHSNEKISLIDRYITDSEISFFFSAADVIVLPYLRASQSGIAHIAMAFGKPIIVSEVGGLKESMIRYSGAFFVPPADSDAITNEILRNFGNKKIYIAPTIGWDEISKQYLNIIREI